MTSWGEHLKESTKEPDGAPSSARIFALWLIGFVLFAQFLIVDCLVWKLLFLNEAGANAVGLASVYSGVLRVFMLWSMLFDVATALSLYGINVWKYVAAMRTGQVALEDSNEERLIQGQPVTSLTPRVSAISKIAIPSPAAVVVPRPPASSGDDDVSPSRVD